MVCSGCGATPAPGAKFCAECGVALTAACPGCGAPRSGGRFCSECGAGLDSPAPPPPATAPAPVAERRLASLLFADLVGFTPLSEARDPEAVRELLSAYFERARAVVERYGGTIEKFIGDAVCAVWGVPVAREDDAELAVLAGLDLVSAVAGLGQDLGIDGLILRVGITTGQVAVTLGAVGEGIVAGDAVNTAARVQSVAQPGEVWVDDTTRSLTSASLAYEPAGSHALKGKAVALQLFRAVRTTAAVGGEQRVDGLEAPFVGRDRELRLVKELFHATAEEQRARLVLVVGEPGIGKSRLSWELEKYLHAITTSATWLVHGRCLSYGQGAAGRVVAEMFRSLLRLADDDEQTVRTALDERLVRVVADPAERDVLRPRLLSLLGLADDVFDQADLFACWRGFLEAHTSDDSSVTVVVEDLQWADDGFLEFLEHLLDAARAPVLVLALARPDVGARRPGLGTGRRSTTVFLDPLPDAAMARLLDGLVADLPAVLRDELVRRADGIPLYAVETVRSLVDRDVVVASGGRYMVDPQALGALDLDHLAPPASLHSLLSARLDALTADERRAVQDGSVLGLSFTRPGLQALTPSGVDLDAALEGLRRKEILTVDNDPRSAERGQLRFVQALLRGVAYDTLSRRDRKARHVAVAEHLAGVVDGDSLAGVLAAHYLDAAAAVPDDGDVAELRDRAVALLERAAVHAMEVGSSQDAVAHYAQVLDLDPADEIVVRVCVAATALWRSGKGLERGLVWVERGLAAAARCGSVEAALSLRLSRCQLRDAAGERGPDVMTDAAAVLQACLGDADRIALTRRAASSIVFFQQYTGDAALARDVSLQALQDIERFGDDTDFAGFLDTMSVWFALAGFRRLSTLMRSASAGRLGSRDPAAGRAHMNLAAVLLHDDPVAATASAGRALEADRAIGMHTLGSTGHLVIALTATGQWGPARVALVGCEDGTELTDWPSYLAAGSALLAWCAGDPGLLRAAVPGAAEMDDAVVVAWASMREAVELFLADRLPEAAANAVTAVEQMAVPSLVHEDLPLAYLLAVEVLLAAGDRRELERLTVMLEVVPRGQRYRLLDAQLLRARAHLSPEPAPGLRAAVEVLDAMGAAYWAAATRVELAQALADAGDTAASARCLDAAEPLLRELGAVRVLPAVERLRAAALLVG